MLLQGGELSSRGLQTRAGDPDMITDTDLLAAETLLLAVVPVVYAVWYPKIEEALGTPRPRQMEQLQDEPALQKRSRLRGAIFARTVPLLVASAILTLTFLPVAWSLAWAAGRDIVVRGLSSLA